MQTQFTLEDIPIWREEIQGYWEQVERFDQLNDVEKIIRKIASFAARVGWMHSVLVRSGNKLCSDFRTKEVDFFLGEVKDQFKFWSRIGTVSQSEWEMSR